MRVLVCVVLVVVTLFAQEPEPVFRTGVRLVQVDVVVKAKNLPVKGLAKSDFQVFDNGKPQQIAVFSVREADSKREPLPKLPEGVVTNQPLSRGPEPVSATVLLIDAQNTPPEAQGYARLQALKFLDRAQRDEYVALLTLDTTLKVAQDFTTDRDALRRAVDGFHMAQSLNLQDGQGGLLAGLSGNAANAMRAANLQRRSDITTGAFESLARSMQGLPGRKKLIWITAALPLTFTQDNERNGVTMTEYTNMSPQIFKPVKLLNDANVAIYPIDPRGVMGGEGGLLDPNLTTMNQLALRTGGKALYADNDLALGIEQAFADTDVTYTLGFYPQDVVEDGKMHGIEVRVNRLGADVRYRRTYSAEDRVKPRSEKFLKTALSEWVNQPLNATEIPLQAAAAPAIGKPGSYDVEVAIDPRALKLEERSGRFWGSIDLAIVPDVENKPKGLHQTIQLKLTPERMAAALNSGILIVNQIRVTNPKGKLLSDRLHLVVMDRATAKAGSVRIPLKPR